MTPDQMRRAIGLHLGWTITPITVDGLADVCILPPRVEFSDDRVWQYAGTQLPDWPGDLNACAEMETGIGDDLDWLAYTRKLWAVVNGGHHKGYHDIYPAKRAFISATAAQRCEAFCKTVGIYREEPS